MISTLEFGSRSLGSSSAAVAMYMCTFSVLGHEILLLPVKLFGQTKKMPESNLWWLASNPRGVDAAILLMASWYKNHSYVLDLKL